ncbi:MurR/RpiR family transcriptional regulator [Virgibacillus halophilus]|uniref:MurR/RpiR family transcriptional regulator n=1 Tax=Tigheibacillus halophilus TaxID=361280 RepID=A0ABU5C314_9BACI|nr:MurR/RpiR family transcriptional regulator [Virgibacillus halophilus]
MPKNAGSAKQPYFVFFKKLGFSGYQEFKVSMAKQLRHPNENNSEPEFGCTYQNIVQMLDDTHRLIDENTLTLVTENIINSQSVYLFGIGFSGLAAQGAQIRFMRLGYKSFVFSDPHAQLVSSHLITEKDLAMAFSITGDTISTIDWLKVAKQNGAKTVAITNHSNSDITKIADTSIYTAGKEIAQEGSTLITEMSQLYIIEEICKHLYEADKDNIDRMKNKISKSID